MSRNPRIQPLNETLMMVQLNSYMDKLIHNDSELKQWKDIDRDRFYLIGIDTASAFGTDSSSIEVIDYVDCEQVAELRMKSRVDDFCPVIAKIATMYPNHLIIPEANSFGNQVYEYLTRQNENYNIYISKTKPADIKNMNKLRFRYGIYTNPQNRPLIIDALYTAVTENPSCIKSRSAILELISLINDKNGKIQAEEGEHDDLSMALAFCFYVRQYDPPTGLKSMINSKQAIEDSLEIISWNDPGSGNFNMSALVKNPYKSQKELEQHDFKETLNKQIQNFINDNFAQLVNSHYNQLNGSSTIDVMKLMGYN
jgi:hypothetical protein